MDKDRDMDMDRVMDKDKDKDKDMDRDKDRVIPCHGQGQGQGQGDFMTKWIGQCPICHDVLAVVSRRKEDSTYERFPNIRVCVPCRKIYELELK